ncbi:MAG: hypothetical protein LBH40_00225 [Alphaproteobacteria bacterium]|jgi:hypothetical protein|nr:hypothetical protein [Alphaproteobacteria bacterium]
MADEITDTPAMQLPQDVLQYYNNIKKNTITIGVGGVYGNQEISNVDNRNYDEAQKLKTKNNFSLSYLRRINRLSLGVDVGIFVNNNAKYTKYADSNIKNNKNRSYVDSNTCQYLNDNVFNNICDDYGYVSDSGYCATNPGNCNNGKIDCSNFYNSSYCNNLFPDPNFGNTNSGNSKPIAYQKTISSNLYTAMFLANYDIYQGKDVVLAIQGGIGANYQELDIGLIEGSNKSIEEKQSATSLATKVGIVGNYYLTDSFAIGTGVHYVYTSQTEFKFANFGNNTVKATGFTTYNLYLTYGF